MNIVSRNYRNRVLSSQNLLSFEATREPTRLPAARLGAVHVQKAVPSTPTYITFFPAFPIIVMAKNCSSNARSKNIVGCHSCSLKPLIAIDLLQHWSKELFLDPSRKLLVS